MTTCTWLNWVSYFLFPIILFQEIQANDSIANSRTTTLDIGFDFNSNTGQYGHFNNISKQPSICPNIYFSGKKGLQLSASVSRVSNADTSYTQAANEANLMAGWNFYLFNEHLSIMPSFTHFAYSANISPERSYYKNQASLTISGFFNWFTPMISGYYLMGGKNEYFLSAYLAFSFLWDDFKNENFAIGFDPAIGFNFGNQNYYGRLATKYYEYLEPLKQRFGNKTVGEILATRYIKAFPNLKKQLQKLNPNTRLTDFLEPKTKFNLSSIEISIPVSFYYYNYTFMAGIYISKPLNVPNYLDIGTTVFLNAGLIYTFNFISN
jgi:hypothetical protein